MFAELTFNRCFFTAQVCNTAYKQSLTEEIIFIFTLSDSIKLKQEILNRFQVKIHFHDACGRQYFTLEKSNENIKKYITEYFKKQNMKAVFSEDGLQFVID